MYRISEHYYQAELQDLVEGETTPLRISQKYLTIAGNREPNIDWSRIPEMLRLAKGSGLSDWWYDETIGHLKDAANEDLDERRRMHHFDHAGSRMWEGGSRFRDGFGYARNLAPFMTLFKRAGGM